ncbi:MAG TPA: caspase family protein [Candidatus Saccharimonadales bacterium]|nr:caspase family protein [Candidatus Saccharimonadales bacterium]
MAFHILSVGVSKYQSHDINNLLFAHDDATEFYNIFKSNLEDLGWDSLLVDNEASLSAVRSALADEALLKAGSDDTFIFFFSGHGTRAYDNGDWSTFLLPFDTTEQISASGVPVSLLRDTFDQLPHGCKLMFLDSCHSGTPKSKSVPFANAKKGEKLKSFITEVTSKGSFVFTACKDDEQAFEHPKIKHGIFTQALVEELTKDGRSDAVPILHIHAPIVKRVIALNKEFRTPVQTPTFMSHMEGSLELPILTKPMRLKPTVIDVPKVGADAQPIASAPIIEITSRNLDELISNTKAAISAITNDNQIVTVDFDSAIDGMIDAVKYVWEKQYDSVKGPDDFPKAVAQVETAAFQLYITGALICLYGHESLVKSFCSKAAQLMGYGYGKAGYVALARLPQLIVVELLYLFGAIGLTRDDLTAFDLLLKSRVYNDMENNGDAAMVGDYRKLHYSDIFGGYATKTFDHINSFMSSSEWLGKVAQSLKQSETLQNFILQTNLVLNLFYAHKGEVIYPNYGKYYAHRVMPFVKKLRADADFRNKVAAIFSVKSDTLLDRLAEVHTKLESIRLGDLTFWDSINHTVFTTDELNVPN